jgi:hypothetical protein
MDSTNKNFGIRQRNKEMKIASLSPSLSLQSSELSRFPWLASRI